jgi:hypothetical protein
LFLAASFQLHYCATEGTSVPTYCHLRLEIVLLESGPITFSELFTIFIRVQNDKCQMTMGTLQISRAIVPAC